VFGLDPGKEFSKIREKVGVVMQDVDEQILGPTVYDDILFAPLNYGLGKSEAEEKAKEMVEALDLLSGEMDQDFRSTHKQKVVDIQGVLRNLIAEYYYKKNKGKSSW
jgi:energy-coupling factor transporter ATP-binding protein EcfA2